MLFSAASCLKRIAAARPAGPAPTITMSYSIMSLMASALFRLHADRAVQADRLAVQHRDLEDRADETRKFLRLAKARREWDLLCERLLILLGNRRDPCCDKVTRRHRHA